MSNHLAIANPTTGPKGLGSGLLKCGSVGAFRAASPLPKDAQELFDKAVVTVGRDRLVIVEDLLAEGLTYNLPNWLAVPTIYYERVGRAGHAQRTMVPKARGERQVQDRAGTTLPIYATWDDFSFGIRELLAAERVGSPLDTAMVEEATRNVNEAVEDQAINGAGFSVNGNSIPGLLTAPNANTQAYVGNEAWDNSGHTGEEILTDVLNMIDGLQADGYYGPYNLYVPTTYGSKLNQDYKSATSGTIRERLEVLEAGGRPIRIRVADQLPANRTALVQMTSNVLDVIVGQTPTNVSWEDGPGWERFFVVLACLIVRFKTDYDGGSGIILGNTT